MNNPKFTKGPWLKNKTTQQWCVAAEGSGSSFDSIDSASRSCPVAFVVHDDWRDEEEMTANGHLISVAPDMYSLLEDLLCNHNLGRALGEKIDDLLSKARGVV